MNSRQRRCALMGHDKLPGLHCHQCRARRGPPPFIDFEVTTTVRLFGDDARESGAIDGRAPRHVSRACRTPCLRIFLRFDLMFEGVDAGWLGGLCPRLTRACATAEMASSDFASATAPLSASAYMPFLSEMASAASVTPQKRCEWPTMHHEYDGLRWASDILRIMPAAAAIRRRDNARPHKLTATFLSSREDIDERD